MMVINKITTYLNSQTSILPLAIFRMAFGFLMSFSMLRFTYKGWIEDAYVTPIFHFTYDYFNWVKPFGIEVMYAIVIGCAISAFLLGIGLFYRLSSVFFFISFTYLELIEKSWYLNHYYFVSLVAFLLILVPANQKYSVDAKWKSNIKNESVPIWTIVIFKLQLSVVYFFGGIAKLKSDWLLDAQPLSIWLKAKSEVPFIGALFQYDSIPYLFSWSGMLYDLLIPFLLWSRKSRPIAYVFVIVFHIFTYILFNIGMFPWLMIFGSLIFITEYEWRLLFKLSSKSNFNPILKKKSVKLSFIKGLLIVFFCIQFTFPLRHFFLTDNVLWTENGFRFSWHVMIMEKNGHTTFIVKDDKTKKQWKEYPSKRLSAVQETQMSFQPDMIWQYALYLEKIYKNKGVNNPKIYVNSKVSLNGRPSKTYIYESIDLTNIENIYKFISN